MKKRIVLIISVFICIFLVGCTIASFKIYDKNLIGVSSFYYKTDIDGELWVKASYLPESCITTNGKGNNVIYRVQNRMGWFAKEYYVEEIPIDFYYEGNDKVYREDGYIRVIEASLEEGDQIVEEVPVGVKDGLTVKWLYGERGKYEAAVWH